MLTYSEASESVLPGSLTMRCTVCNGPQPMIEQSSPAPRLTVRLGAIAANYRKFRELSDRAIVAGVVKADAYGCGAAQAAKTLRKEGCDTFFVARLSEGVALRPIVGDARIFVLDGAQAESVPALIAHRLTPVLNSLDEIALWNSAAHRAHANFDCAIHIDTGMNRLGLSNEETSILSDGSNTRLANINLVLLMSHLACSDDCDNSMNAAQLGRFKSVLAKLPSAPASLASSGGVLLGKHYLFDMVRPGIGLYGGNPLAAGRENPFMTVARMTGRILQIRRVDSGESVGYGATFQIERNTILATVSLGYADGLMRALSNRGFGAIAGHRAPVAGRVSMDLVTLDVTDIPQDVLRAGAEVEFFGDTISLEEAAASANTASYELITSLGARLPRHYVEGMR